MHESEFITLSQCMHIQLAPTHTLLCLSAFTASKLSNKEDNLYSHSKPSMGLHLRLCAALLRCFQFDAMGNQSSSHKGTLSSAQHAGFRLLSE